MRKERENSEETLNQIAIDDNHDAIIKEIKASLLIGIDDNLDPAQRAVIEAGGGEAEGWELAEEDLIKHASHGDERSDTVALNQASPISEEDAGQGDIYGESDSTHHQD